MEKRLERYLDEAQIGGVAAGLAHYFGIDRTLVRVLFVAGLFIPAVPSLILYVILWIVLPERRFGPATQMQSTIFSTPVFMANPEQKRNGNLIGGAILIILGVVALLERYTDIDFRDIWPLLLIGFGVWLVVRDRKPGEDLFGRGTGSFGNDTPENRPTPPSNDPYDPDRTINQL